MNRRAPTARILVLTNVDWSSMTRASFASQDDPTRPLPFLASAAEHELPRVFEETFGVDFFRYRAEVRRIAESNLRSVEDARLTIGFDDFQDWFHDDEDEFVFPIDDDDLYHPALARVLDHARDDTRVILWDSVQAGSLEYPPPVRLWLDQPTAGCRRYFWPALLQNNWAVRKSFLRERFDAATARRFLADHAFGHGCLARHHGASFTVSLLGSSMEWTPLEVMRDFPPLTGAGVVHLADCLSVNFVHVGSVSFFVSLALEGSAASLYGRYDPGRPVELPDYAAWAEPHLRELCAVIPRLRR